MSVSWPSVVLALGIVAGCVTAAVLGQKELALILVGLSAGITTPAPLTKRTGNTVPPPPPAAS